MKHLNLWCIALALLANSLYASHLEIKTQAEIADTLQPFSTHGLLIFLDDSEKSIRALVKDVYPALEQKAAPILVSTSLLITLFVRTPTLTKLTELTGDKKYVEIDDYYNRLQKRLAELIGNKKGVDPAEQERIVSLLNKEFSQPAFDETTKIPALGYTKKGAVANALLRQNIHFNPTEWIIKSVDADRRLFLLVPKNYRNALNEFDFANYTPGAPHAATAPCTEVEYKTGLKIDHMRTVTDFFKELADIHETDTEFADYFMKAVVNQTTKNSDIFVTNVEYAAKKYPLPKWTIFISGHGDVGQMQTSLSIQDFSEFLNFLRRINTTLFIYITCYAIGSNENVLYKDLEKPTVATTYPFIIVAEGATDTTIGSYYELAVENFELADINFESKRFQFKKYFYNEFIKKSTQVVSDKFDLAQLISTVIPLKAHGAGQITIPQIRLPGGDWQPVAHTTNRIAFLANIFAKTCQKVDIQKYFTKGGVIPEFYFMYAPILPCELIFSFGPEKMPLFIPMATPKLIEKPDQLYYIEKISAPLLTLTDIIHMFLDAVVCDAYYTLWIKEVTAKNGGPLFPDHPKITVSDMIMHITDQGELSLYFTYNGKLHGTSIKLCDPTAELWHQLATTRQWKSELSKNPAIDFSLTTPPQDKEAAQFVEGLQQYFQLDIERKEGLKQERENLEKLGKAIANRRPPRV
jgi:hypothetical protein